jgi:hypothetical protein
MGTATDEAIFATVTVGMPALRRLVFVPLAEATVGPGSEVTYTKGQVKGARTSISTGSCQPGRGSGVWAL